ncbi:hypothetical protein, partial [Vibrio harveyi]|uniref:hypothetical protein n=1 Tax=Vibrio harveyi TaxID=669 RepID=UPI001E3F4716
SKLYAIFAEKKVQLTTRLIHSVNPTLSCENLFNTKLIFLFPPAAFKTRMRAHLSSPKNLLKVNYLTA